MRGRGGDGEVSAGRGGTVGWWRSAVGRTAPLPTGAPHTDTARAHMIGPVSKTDTRVQIKPLKERFINAWMKLDVLETDPGILNTGYATNDLYVDATFQRCKQIGQTTFSLKMTR